MKRKKLLLLFVSTCLILALTVSPFMAACAAPVEPGVVDVAALQKEIASLKKEVASGEKEIASLKGKITTAEAKASTSEKEAAASKKEIASAEKEIAALEKEKTAAEKEIASLEGKVAAAEKEIAKLEAAAPVPAEVLEWRLSSHWSPMELEEQQWFTREVGEASDGRLDITAYACDVLMPSAENIWAVKDGIVEMALTCGSYYSDVIPVGDIEFGVPFGWRGRSEAAAFFYQTGFLEDILRPAYAEHNVYYLAPVLCSRYTMMTVDPVYSLEEMTAKTIRCIGGVADTLEKVGVPTTYVTGSEIYMALATGVLDGFVWCCPYTYYLLKYYEVCSSIVAPDLMDPLAVNFLVNMDDWNALPDDLKAILTRTSKSSLFDATAYWIYGNAEATSIMATEYGVVVTSLPDEDVAQLTEAAFEVWDEIGAKDAVYAAPAVELLKDFVRTMGHI